MRRALVLALAALALAPASADARLTERQAERYDGIAAHETAALRDLDAEWIVSWGCSWWTDAWVCPHTAPRQRGGTCRWFEEFWPDPEVEVGHLRTRCYSRRAFARHFDAWLALP